LDKIIQRAKNICKSKKVRIFAILVVLLLAAIWILKSLLSGSVGEYQITEIPSQGGTLFLRSLNDSGQAVGWVIGSGQERAVVWDTNAGTKNLSTPDGYSSLAMSINNSGEVCGELRDPNNKRHGCFWDSGGRMRDIGTLGGRVSIVQKLNDKGQVVGWSQTSSNAVHAFLWTKEQGIMDLDTRGAMYSYATSINNQGQVVGYLRTNSRKSHAFVWREETGMVDIHDKLEGAESMACGINCSGQIIGQYITEDNQSRAFVWDESKGFRDLKIVSDREWGCWPLSITDSGQGIVAMHEKPVKIYSFDLHPGRDSSFLLGRRFKRLRMDKALPFETNQFTAYDINNKGQIIISANISRTTKWYLMTPAAADN
jgi:probable HAF family extracellular repeat protein